MAKKRRGCKLSRGRRIRARGRLSKSINSSDREQEQQNEFSQSPIHNEEQKEVERNYLQQRDSWVQQRDNPQVNTLLASIDQESLMERQRIIQSLKSVYEGTQPSPQQNQEQEQPVN